MRPLPGWHRFMGGVLVGGNHVDQVRRGSLLMGACADPEPETEKPRPGRLESRAIAHGFGGAPPGGVGRSTS